MWDNNISEEMELADFFQVLEPAYELAMASNPRRLTLKGHFPYTVHKTAILYLFLKCGWPKSIQPCRGSWEIFQLPLRLYKYFIMSSVDGNLVMFVLSPSDQTVPSIYTHQISKTKIFSINNQQRLGVISRGTQAIVTIYDLLPPTSGQYIEGWSVVLKILVPNSAFSFQKNDMKICVIRWSFLSNTTSISPYDVELLIMPKYSYDCNKLKGIEKFCTCCCKFACFYF